MHLRVCSHCRQVCKVVCKHGKYCDECRQLITKIHQLHSKIAIVGPINSGKTQLFDMLKSNHLRQIMNFAKASILFLIVLQALIICFNSLSERPSLIASIILSIIVLSTLICFYILCLSKLICYPIMS